MAGGRAATDSGTDKNITVWDVRTGAVRAVQRGHVGATRGLAFSPDGRTLASGGEDHAVKLWDAIAGQELLTLEGHRLSVLLLRSSPDGSTLAGYGAEAVGPREVFLWDARDAQPVRGGTTLEAQ